MSRLTLRREFKPSTWAHDPAQQVRFDALPMHRMFFLTPPGTTRLTFIKVNKWGAQIEDSSNESSWPDQSFSPETLVYEFVPAKRKDTKS